MASLLRKLRPSVSPPVPAETEDSIGSYEYSFAVVYTGPPLTYSIPEVPAFKIDQIPLASIAPPLSHDLSLPIIQPLSTKKNPKLQSTTTSTVTETASDHDCSMELQHPTTSGCVQRDESVTATRQQSQFKILDEATKIASDRDCSMQWQHPTTSDCIQSDNTETAAQLQPQFKTLDDTTESGSSSLSISSEICSMREDEITCETTSPSPSPKHVKRPSAVTFRDPETKYMEETESEEFNDSEFGIRSTPVRPRAVRPGKKGSCYRCLKGNLLTMKEVCIVCNAKYCHKCVIKAMGSMPQGRKCVTCIGYGIDEEKRWKLGKCSRMLKHVLSEQVVDQVMQDERSCDINQIPPELVCVNLQPLNREQLMLLLHCRNPPKQLKPGSYWYDKASGFWGKEGQPPSEIISPQLDVGGRLPENASNGDTNVTINDRRITKKELVILKMARVPCEGTPNFWVNADGSYKEEGQRSDRGNIWEKRRVKLACAVLSLPVPPNSVTLSDEGEVAAEVKLHQKVLRKFLLVGSVNSGACTIFKQAKLLYDVPFSENELQNIKLVIQSNLFTYLGILLEGREIFEQESLLENRKRWPADESTSYGNAKDNVETTIYSIGKRLKGFADWLLKYMVSGNLEAVFPAAIREYGPMVEDLWRDDAIQATYSRRNELKMLPRSANYFLDRAIEISKIDYEPSEMDILYAEGISLSNSLTSMEFSFPKLTSEDSLYPEYQHDSSLRYQLIRVHPSSLGENCKWLEMFEDTDVVLFSVALSDYDEYIVDNKGVSTNKMMLAKHLFETIIAHPIFHNKKFLLILTKVDLLEEKIEQIPLTRCEWFSDYHPFISPNQKKGSNNTVLAQSASHYIAVKFKKLFCDLTERILFVSMVTGLEHDTIDEALRYSREIMEWEKWDPSFIAESEKSEITTTSIEEASSS